MIARLCGGTSYDGNFDVPEPVFPSLEKEFARLAREYPGLSFEIGSVHTHDRGHRLVECRAVSTRHDVDKVADYLDSWGFYLYAEMRGEDVTQRTLKQLNAI